MRRMIKRGDHGLSMLELMAALAVIAIAMMGVLSMIIHTVAIRESMREMEVAKEWTFKRIEEVKSQKFSDLNQTVGGSPIYLAATGSTLYSGTFTPGANPVGVPNSSDLGPPSSLAAASGVLTVDYSNPRLYEIVATVNWKGRKGSGTYTMRSLCAQ